MHGSIIALLTRYVQTPYDHSTSVKSGELSGPEHIEFDHKSVYPDEHVYALVGRAVYYDEADRIDDQRRRQTDSHPRTSQLIYF